MQIFTCVTALFLRWQDELTLWNSLPRVVNAHPGKISRNQRIQFVGGRQVFERENALNQLVAGDLLLARVADDRSPP